MGGVDKGLLLFEGLPLASRTARLLAGVFEEVVLVSNTQEAYPGLPAGVLRTGDLFPGQGPLAGVHAGLARSSGQAACCLACDLPFLSAGFLRRLARRFRRLDCDVLLPRIGERIEPLAAIYRRSLLPALESLLADGQGNSLRRLFPAVRTAYLELGDRPATRRLFTNLNTPEDYQKACGV
jgi:molybdopterin-guanine dinucleotide biosynthesis protein A